MMESIEELPPKNAAYWKHQAREKDAEIERLNAQIAMLCDALQLLMDNQNGCPLPKYEADWNQAMSLSAASISATESDVKTWLESHDKQVRKYALEDVGAIIGVGATFEEVIDWLASEFRAIKEEQ